MNYRIGRAPALPLLLAAMATVSATAAAPMIHLPPGQMLMDDVTRIRLSDLRPNQHVTLRAGAQILGFSCRSQATFIADQQGRVDLDKSAPVEGSYAGVAPMGLFWSMTMEQVPSTVGQATSPREWDPVVTHLDLQIDGRVVTSTALTRWWARPGVRITEVRENGLRGRLFEPVEKGRHPAMLVLSGSEGGINDREAALLASRGYVAFALAYFRFADLPQELVNIPLEYLKRGADWLRRRPMVKRGGLGVIGGSKGGELALLLGATFPAFRAVVAYAPSSVVGPGLDQNNSGKQSSWTYRGKPLPFVPFRATPAFTSQFAGDAPIRLIDLYRPSLEQTDAVRHAAIPVERIHGPVLLISGQDDQMGPSTLHGDRVIARLRAHKHPYDDRHLSYLSAGHAIYTAFMPTTTSTRAGRWALGGTPKGNARAMAASWPQVLRFLKESLAGQDTRRSFSHSHAHALRR